MSCSKTLLMAMASLSMVTIGILTLTGCAPKTEDNFYTDPPTGNSLVAAPVATAFYPYQIEIYSYDHQPSQAYEQLGDIKVSRMSNHGAMRQKATIKMLLREQASIMGGDGVIILPDSNEISCHAQIIKYLDNYSSSDPDNSSE